MKRKMKKSAKIGMYLSSFAASIFALLGLTGVLSTSTAWFFLIVFTIASFIFEKDKTSYEDEDESDKR